MKTTRRSVLLTLPAALVALPAAADQPHMDQALGHLRAAVTELERADADKGGHRANAIKLTRDAIAEVERGISFARHH